MYKDLISYELADGVSEEQLLTIAGRIITEWMRDLKGFIAWEIHKTDSGYTDVVYWETKEDAHNAEKKMAEIPNASEWYGCYKEGSIIGTKLVLLKRFE